MEQNLKNKNEKLRPKKLKLREFTCGDQQISFEKPVKEKKEEIQKETKKISTIGFTGPIHMPGSHLFSRRETQE